MIAMPGHLWTKKDERQYQAIVTSCDRPSKTCERIGAAVVNKRRASKLAIKRATARKGRASR